jgi:hypothetical protein
MNKVRGPYFTIAVLFLTKKSCSVSHYAARILFTIVSISPYYTVPVLLTKEFAPVSYFEHENSYRYKILKIQLIYAQSGARWGKTAELVLADKIFYEI